MDSLGKTPVIGEIGGATAGRSTWITPTSVAHAAFVPTGIVTVLLGPLLPWLSGRWSLSDAQSGEFFTAQFLASTLGVAFSGVLVPRLGYRFAMFLGLLFMVVGVGTLPIGSRVIGMVAVGCYGIGLGLTIPTCNLLVAEVNPETRAAALSLLNFSWSVGAVACPFLLAPFQRAGRIPMFFFSLAAFVLLVALSLAWVALPQSSPLGNSAGPSGRSLARLLSTPAAIALGVLFFVYVGTENAVGGWLASYAKRLVDQHGTMWVTTPSFFYGGLLAGRALAPVFLKRIPEVRLVRLSVATALAALIGLLASRSITLVLLNAAMIGLGLAAIYPITISLLSHAFGPAATRVGSVMFMLASFGAACMPWLVGLTSTKMSSLKYGLAVPLLGCAVMLGLYFRDWEKTANPSLEPNGTRS
jgi:FHS family glucose/mannose:H+ symporter-like MFS transporter